MAKVTLLDSTQNLSLASTTEYESFGIGAPDNAGAGTETNQYRTARTPGTISNLWVQVISNTASGGDSTIRSRVNTANGNMAVAIGASTTGQFTDAVNSDSISAGDEFNHAMTTASGGDINFIASGIFDADTNTVATYIVGEMATGSDSTTEFLRIAGSGFEDTNETQNELVFRTAGTLKNLFALVKTNDYSDAATVIKSRINGVDGNVTVSVTASTTGIFEDTVNTDSISIDDTVNWAFVIPATGTTFIVGVTAVDFETTNKKFMWSGGDFSETINNATRYFGASGFDDSATESDRAQDAGIACTVSELTIISITNAHDAATTFKVRKDGVDGNGTLSIAASTTGTFNDAINTDDFTSTQEYSMEASNAGTGNLDIVNWAVLVENTEVTLKNLLMMGVGV